MQNNRETSSFRYSVNGMLIQTITHYWYYLKLYKFLKKSQWWSKEELEKYQQDQLNKLLDHAYNNVPYYRKVFDMLGLKPKDIKTIQDLQKLPYLTKKIVRENIEDFKALNYSKFKFELSWTGGSTGQPLYFYIEKGVWLAQLMAYSEIQNDCSRLSFFDKSVFITGIENPIGYQLFGRTLVLSSFHMKEKNFPLFIEKIKKLKPKYILGYPSAIYLLARYMEQNNIDTFPSLKVIISQAETLYDWQRELLEEIFQCPVHDRYGLRETVAIGGTCDNSHYFHMFPQYGIVELIGKDGKPVTKEDEIGEIIGTGFHTHIFPFIRYKTGDLGVFTKKKCSCGRNYLLLKRIFGRLQDFIVSKNKQLIPIMGIHHLIAESSKNILESQLYQEKEGEIILNIVKTENYSEADSRSIKNNFNKRFGKDFVLSIQYVNEIPRTGRGKYKFLIQKLPFKFENLDNLQY